MVCGESLLLMAWLAQILADMTSENSTNGDLKKWPRNRDMVDIDACTTSVHAPSISSRHCVRYTFCTALRCGWIPSFADNL
mmetsp:Transcript_17336/g.41484  ORF Transcript_17336/g.41484 Transcript_17336/m.41484 type:complete len:81 (+) Transcript_17336:248-490(+)